MTVYKPSYVAGVDLKRRAILQKKLQIGKIGLEGPLITLTRIFGI